MASTPGTKRVGRTPAGNAHRALVISRVALRLGAAAAAGLTAGKKTKRLSCRTHEELFNAAAARTGLDGTELLEYALAKDLRRNKRFGICGWTGAGWSDSVA